MGSGTTAVAAKNLGRYYIGFEINHEFYALASERLNEIMTDQQAKTKLFSFVS
jgi:site-specific DNA-methyltransferase (adenine-specific)